MHEIGVISVERSIKDMREIIASKDNQHIKLVRSLDKKKARTKAGLFVVEGVRNCYEALTSAAHISFLLVKESKYNNPEITKLTALAAEKAITVLAAEDRVFDSAGNTEESQGVIAVAEMFEISEEEFRQRIAGRHIAVLDGLQDPGNAGTILRTAWAAGLGGVVLVDNSADLYNPKVVRSAMGAVYHVPFIRLDNAAAVKLLGDAGCVLAVADAAGEDFRAFSADGKPIAWLLGSEGGGVSDFWRQQAAATVSIPMAPDVESLNVAVAAGILFFSHVEF